MKKLIIILTLTFLFSCSSDKNTNNYSHLMSSTKVLRDINEIEFMGETLKIDDYTFFRERLEREFYIITDNITQFKLWVKRT